MIPAIAIAIAAVCSTASFEDAQAALEAYRTALQAQPEVQADQDAAQALEAHQQTIVATLRDAQRAFVAAGIDEAGSADDLAGYAYVLEQSGNSDLAARFLERAIDLSPDDAALWVRYGANLDLAGPAHRETALEALRKALALAPDTPIAATAWLGVGRIMRREGLSTLAREAFEQGLAIDPESVPLRLAHLVEQTRNGEIAAAGATLLQLRADIAPYDQSLRRELRAALADFDNMRLTVPDTAATHAASSRLYYQAARFVDALLAAQRAVSLNPDDYETHTFIGQVQAQLGNLPQAREALERSLSVNADQPDARQTLDQVIEVLERAAQQQPSAPATPQP